jgi:hypothetical protein
MNDAVSDIQLREEPKARSRQRFPRWEPDEDEISVKDVLDLSPKPTSKSVRYAFETFGFTIQRFVKMPGRGVYCLQVRRKSATPYASIAARDRNARRSAHSRMLLRQCCRDAALSINKQSNEQGFA